MINIQYNKLIQNIKNKVNILIKFISKPVQWLNMDAKDFVDLSAIFDNFSAFLQYLELLLHLVNWSKGSKDPKSIEE